MSKAVKQALASPALRQMLQHGKGLVNSSELCVCQSAMTGKLTVSLIGENHGVMMLNDGFVIFQHVIAVMHSLP